MKRHHRCNKFLYIGGTIICLSLALVGCTQSSEETSSDVSSSAISMPATSSATSNNDKSQATVSETPLNEGFSSLKDLTSEQQEQLLQAVSDVYHLNFDIAVTNADELLYQAIIGPTASSFWSFFGTGDSEADYRKYIKEDGRDPLGLFTTYGQFDADDVDWILANIYHTTPIHTEKPFESSMYYHDGFYYVKWFATGFEPGDITLVDLKDKGNDQYEVKYHAYDPTDQDNLLVTGVATLKRRMVEEKKYWTYLAVQATYNHQDDMA